MNKRIYHHFGILAIVLFFISGCSKDQEIITRQNGVVYDITKPPAAVVPLKPAIDLQITHVAGNDLLQYDVKYENESGERFTVDVFKYYFTNIVLVYDSVTKVALPETYFLVDQSKPASKTIRLTQMPQGNLTGIEFLIGVDAFRNNQGAQTGDLDPVLGMFWTWNSGYIMAKLEGQYERAGKADGSYIWHCGSASMPYSSVRNVHLDLPPTTIDTLNRTTIALNADVLEWFKKPYTIKIADTPVFNDPRPLSSKVADNYADMFSVKSVGQAPF